MARFLLPIAALLSPILAKTDLTGCTTTDVSSPAGASVAWYVPGTGELCDFLDCGGGRAPPKYSVPGCPQYTGTASYSPSYLPGYGEMVSSTSTTSTASGSSVGGGDWVSTTSAVVTDGLGTQIGVSETTVAALETSAVSTTTGNLSAVASVSVVSSTSRNGTVASATPTSSPVSTGAARETVRVWLGGVGLLGLVAVVVAL